MRFEVFGFNQKLVVEQFGDKLDTSDLLLLDYTIDAIASPTMKHIVKDDVAYVWLSHEKILADLPILNIGEDALKKRLKRLVELGLLTAEKSFANNNRGGSKAFYSITETCYEMRFSEEERSGKNYTSNDERSGKFYTSIPERSGKNYTSNRLLAKTDRELTKTDKEDIVENRTKTTVDDVLRLYHSKCVKLPKVRTLTDKRRQAILKILKKYNLADIEEAFERANASAFCCGNNDRGWTADIDFILREDKFVALLEGKYDGRSGISKRIEQNVHSSSHRADIKKLEEEIANGTAIVY